MNALFDETAGPSGLFEGLVEHFAAIPDARLEMICQEWGLEDAHPEALARCWCRRPDDVLESLQSVSKRGRTALLDLVYDHDMEVDISWLGQGVRRELADLGILIHGGVHLPGEDTASVPGAIAAIVAPMLDRVRPSLPILFGRQDFEQLEVMANAWDVSTEGSRVELTIRCADQMYRPEALDDIIDRLGSPDWLGAAMVVLEFGGLCFWQEVFGFGADDDDGEDNVVPLMRQQERQEEERIAERLQELGVLVRFQEPGSDWASVAVPEVLWGGIWALGRRWLLQWLDQSYRALEDQAVGRSRPRDQATLQTVGTWLVCRTQSGRLAVDEEGEPDQESLDDLEALCNTATPKWRNHLELLMELSVLRRDHTGWVLPGPESSKLLDLPASEFKRNVMYEWTSGFVGRTADRHLPEAIGLDDSWRTSASELLRAQHEFIPVWMEHEGVAPQQTGAGCLREEHDNPPEHISTELGLLNGYVWGMKLLWLDLLSMLPDGRWYPRGLLVELMQMSASVSLFSQVGFLLENPGAWYYLPVQRTSYLTGPVHTEAFENWIDDLVEGLLQPLGAARVEPDDDLVEIQTEVLRVESPPGWPEEQRTMLLQELFGDDLDSFEIPSGGRRDLQAVSQPAEPVDGKLDLSLPLSELVDALKDREITGFYRDSIGVDG